MRSIYIYSIDELKNDLALTIVRFIKPRINISLRLN